MTNQMKKLLLQLLILSYVSFGVCLLAFLVNGFKFNSFVSYIVLITEVPVCAYLQYLYVIIKEGDKLFNNNVFRAKKLLELREGAKLKFYKDNGIQPKYNEDGTVMDPDAFIGILTTLDENGQLNESVYEMLGIKPRFDKDGNQIPIYVVLKHLMAKPKTTGFEKIAKYAKLKTPSTVVEKTPEKTAQKKLQQEQTSETKKSSSSKKEKVNVPEAFKEKKKKKEPEPEKIKLGASASNNGPKTVKEADKISVGKADNLSKQENKNVNKIEDDNQQVQDGGEYTYR